MNKHITDHPDTSKGNQIGRAFASVMRRKGKAGPHASTLMLQRRMRPAENANLGRYLAAARNTAR